MGAVLHSELAPPHCGDRSSGHIALILHYEEAVSPSLLVLFRRSSLSGQAVALLRTRPLGQTEYCAQHRGGESSMITRTAIGSLILVMLVINISSCGSSNDDEEIGSDPVDWLRERTTHWTIENDVHLGTARERCCHSLSLTLWAGGTFIIFHPLRTYDVDAAGSWSGGGSRITLSQNDDSTMTGVVSADGRTIRGTGQNLDGKTWAWSATRTP